MRATAHRPFSFADTQIHSSEQNTRFHVNCRWYCSQLNNPWIWRENQRGVLIGFSYSEIRFLNKNIVKYLKINAIFRRSIYFVQLFFVLQHYR